jgi:hypothetical protein
MYRDKLSTAKYVELFTKTILLRREKLREVSKSVMKNRYHLLLPLTAQLIDYTV